MTPPIAPRIIWALELMDIQPGDHLLEIGCGHGIAVSAICERLSGGTIAATDRSSRMVELARQRNEAWIVSGVAEILTTSLLEADLAESRFDTIFAINIGDFWAKPGPEFQRVRELLTPGGTLYLIMQPPLGQDRKLEGLTARALNSLAAEQFRVEKVTTALLEDGSAAAIVARPEAVGHEAAVR